MSDTDSVLERMPDFKCQLWFPLIVPPSSHTCPKLATPAVCPRVQPLLFPPMDFVDFGSPALAATLLPRAKKAVTSDILLLAGGGGPNSGVANCVVRDTWRWMSEGAGAAGRVRLGYYFGYIVVFMRAYGRLNPLRRRGCLRAGLHGFPFSILTRVARSMHAGCRTLS